MSRRLFRLAHERRCDCIACFGWRLVRGFFLTGLVALLAVTTILELGASKALLVSPPENSR